jgi:hypothetical protein
MERQATRTGSDGAFRFSVIFNRYYIQVKRAGFDFGRVPSISVESGHSVTDLDIRLQPAGVITGSIHDQDEMPLRQVAVSARCQGDRNGGFGQTNAEGVFRIPVSAPDDCYVLSASSPAGPESMPRDSLVWYPNADSTASAQLVHVKPGEDTSPITFKVRVTPTGAIEPYVPGAQGEQQTQPPAPSAAATGSISGHVYRADNGAPVVGATVVLLFSGPRPPPSTGFGRLQFNRPPQARTGPDGAYQFPNLEPGNYTLRADRSGFVAVSYGVPPGDLIPPFPGTEISVAAGQFVAGIDVRLPPEGSISGNVRDQDGLPVEGMTITVSCASSRDEVFGPSLEGPTRGVTDDEGDFIVAGLLPGQCYVGAIPDPELDLAGYETAYYPAADMPEQAQLVPVKAGAGTLNIEIAVKHEPTYEIRVIVPPGGNDPADGHYTAMAIPSEGGQVRVPQQAQWRLRTAATGPDRIARLYGIRPGTYSITLTPMRPTMGPDGQIRGWNRAGGMSVANAIVHVVDADVSVEIPISRFMPGQR